MKRPLHIFALFLFALTQCIAPFAHAHVDGVQGGHASIHVSDLPHAQVQPELAHCHIESHESQAVSLQQEFQRDDTTFSPAVAVSAIHPLPRCLAPAASDVCAHPRPGLIAYHLPHPQAPPA
jgi:hypothetical protein